MVQRFLLQTGRLLQLDRVVNIQRIASEGLFLIQHMEGHLMVFYPNQFHHQLILKYMSELETKN